MTAAAHLMIDRGDERDDTKPKGRELRPVVTYPRDAVLDIEHVALALGVSVSLIERNDVPCCYIGAKRRFVWGVVLDHLSRESLK